MNRVDLIEKIGKEFPNGIGVEVGTFKGGFSKMITDVWGGTLFMVDVWRPLGEEYLDGSNHEKHPDAYSEAMKSISGREDRAIMIRAESKKAAELFQDESLDFVYIDANHAYDYVVEDIKLWYPKVKKGGYLLGHDYLALDWYKDPNSMDNGKDKHIYDHNGYYFGVFGVNPAVDEFCEKNNYEKIITEEWFGTWALKKKLNLHILVSYDDNYKEIAKYSIEENISKYCELHGYTLNIDYQPSFNNEKPAQWRKIQAALEILENDEKIDWLFFIDADCLIMNSDIKLESFINTGASFIVPSHTAKCDNEIENVDGIRNIITSQFLVKNDDYGKSILRDIWNAEGNDKIDKFDYEGRQVRILINSGKYRNKIKIIEGKLLNRFWHINNPFMIYHSPEFRENLYQTGDFIVHVTGYENSEKPAIISNLSHFSKLKDNGEIL